MNENNNSATPDVAANASQQPTQQQTPPAAPAAQQPQQTYSAPAAPVTPQPRQIYNAPAAAAQPATANTYNSYVTQTQQTTPASSTASTYPYQSAATSQYGATQTTSSYGTSQYGQPAKKSGGVGKIALVAICVILSFVAGMLGSLINLGGSAEPVPIEVVNYADNPWTYVADQVLESTVTIYAMNQEYMWTGSGVIISEDGYILTNHHVGGDPTIVDMVAYIYGDSTEYSATLIASDSHNDIALIKINASDLKPVRFGNSETVKVGDRAAAVGNPGGVNPDTFSEGIISNILNDSPYEIYAPDCFQMTVSITGGNSGGGLFNYRGELIGLSCAGYAPYDMENVAFALRIYQAIDVVRYALGDDYISDDTTIDATVKAYDKSAAKSLGLNGEGVYIDKVDDYGAAFFAGLKANDKIISINNVTIRTEADFNSAIGKGDVGTYVKVQIERDGQQYIYNIQLARAFA